MGFRTLAIEQRSSEVWTVLGQAKTEFRKYAEVLDKIRNKLHEATSAVDRATVRTRAIERKLRGVEEAPAAVEAPPGALPAPSTDRTFAE
jgi:DNA recombination protein RmuC